MESVKKKKRIQLNGAADEDQRNMLDVALNHYRAGQLDVARRIARGIVEVHAGDLRALHLLGMIAQQKGATDEALHLYRQVLKVDPNNCSALIESGKLLQAAGNHRDACSAFTHAIQIEPGNIHLRNMISVSLESLGKFEAALHHLQVAVKIDSTSEIILNNIGIVYLKLGAPENARKAFAKAVSIAPLFADAYNHLSTAYRQLGDLSRALQACRKALSITPDSAEALHQAGLLFQKTGRLDEAQKHYNKAIEIRPDFHEAHFNLGNLMKDREQYVESVDAYQQAIRCKPDCHMAIGNMGNAFMFMRDDEAAIAAWEKAISIKPDNAQAYAHIATLRHFKSRDRFVSGMEALLKKPDLTAAQKIHLHFALSKAYEDLGRYDRAFRLMAEGNRMKRNTFDYDEAISRREFASIKELFTDGFIKARKGCGFPDPTPIFILGMPRSGTSLVEQILSSHPDVFGAGELSHLDMILSAKSRAFKKGKFPAYIELLERKDFKTLGSEYIQKIRIQEPNKQYITDKMPQNFLFVGMIKLILPQAKIIHCRRSPMDTCFSIFKTNFTRLHKYSHSLKEIGRYYRLYQELMEHWQETLPNFIYDIRYEELVSDPDTQVRALIDYCDLDWSDRCMNFHRSRRPVLTASTAQVRRPFYKGSVELWRNYERHLHVLKACLSS